uniref:Uncharacterized protein n=1 Tax=Anguilla anguilla TaxID=7936 RepID=A0A0E9TJ59_ANGAN
MKYLVTEAFFDIFCHFHFYVIISIKLAKMLLTKTIY